MSKSYREEWLSRYSGSMSYREQILKTGQVQRRLSETMRPLFAEIDGISVQDLIADPTSLLKVTEWFYHWSELIAAELPSMTEFESDCSRMGCEGFIEGLARNIEYKALQLRVASAFTHLPIQAADLQEIAIELRRLIKKKHTAGNELYLMNSWDAFECFFKAKQTLSGLVYVMREYIRLKSRVKVRSNSDTELMRRILHENRGSKRNTILAKFKEARVVNGKKRGIKREDALKLISAIENGEV